MDNVATVQAIYDAFGKGDVPGMLEHIADDVAWDQDGESHGIPIYEPGQGKDHVLKFLEACQGIEFNRFEPVNFLVGGNQVGVTVNVEVTVKSTGKSASAHEVHLWTFGDDGKVIRLFHCIDRHPFVLAYDL